MKPIRMRAALRAVDEAERDLARELRKVAERHAAEHDVFRIGNRLAAMCDDRVAQLSDHAARYEAAVPDDDFAPFAGLVAAVRRHTGEAVARADLSAVLLLRDLRHLYVSTSECSVSWTILNQGAKAARDDELVAFAYACEQDVGRTLKWLEGRIKETAPQVLAG